MAAPVEEVGAVALNADQLADGAVVQLSAGEAVDRLEAALLDDLVAFGPPKDREVEAAKAKERSAKRFATA